MDGKNGVEKKRLRETFGWIKLFSKFDKSPRTLSHFTVQRGVLDSIKYRIRILTPQFYSRVILY